MAVRLNKRQIDKSISAIQTTNTLRRLQEHVNGEIELSQTQIAAARILLDKTIPNMKPADYDGDQHDELVIRWAK